MRNIYLKIVICCVSFGMLVSCEEYLEEQPISDVLLQDVSESNLNTIIAGVFEPLTRSRGRAWESNLGQHLTVLNESMLGRSGSHRAISKYNLDRINAGTYWITLYNSIGRANSLLAALETSNLSQASKDRGIGETLFARAFVYYTLVRLFGEVPLRLEPVANSDQTGTPLSSISDIYDQIILDVKQAENLLDPVTSRPGAPTSGAAKVMLADIYLTLGQHNLAASKAKEVIDNSGLFGYALLQDFPTVFSPTLGTHSEEVFFLKFSQVPGLGNFLTAKWAPRKRSYALDGGIAARGLEVGGVTADSPLVANWDDNDLRKSWTIYDELLINGQMTNVVGSNAYDFLMGKYKDPSAVEETAAGNDWPAYRYADALLIFAEADNIANGGPSQEGYDAVNQIRRRAYGVDFGTPNPSIDFPLGLNMQEFDELVFQERGYEFFGEGKRWFDLVRTGKYITFLPDAGFNLPNQMFADIPDSELTANDQIN